MAVTGQTITDKCKTTLIDPNHTRWGEPEYLAAINEGQRQIVNLRPEAGTVGESVNTVPGARQSLPAGALRLVSVLSGPGGQAVTEVATETMDRYRPAWRNETADAAEHYLFDDREPTTYYLYPGPAEAGTALVRYVKAPSELSDLADPISLPDLYEPALRFFVMYFLLSKDTGAADFQKAGTYYGMFAQLLAGKVEASQMLNPEQMMRRMSK